MAAATTDDDGPVYRSGEHREGASGVRPQARTPLRLQDTPRGSKAGAGLSQINLGGSAFLQRTHSSRNAIAGSICVARQAGIAHATIAVAASSAAVPPNVVGSIGLTANRRLAMNRVT